ncbi:hypothetical protein [Halarsenatibacter silvermanii]|uniref:Uncharacterized protein n=1 Tax=Halarsenatibacter silvermanii TaxID=321763 RepID=A0A1G9NKR5_9FIRM|nr:hypothetical protein [Halarsenatibacter silvermanii]SDL86960.1 hypothetical protein SAMN04488692_110107 [Halarsenatibacter silvermanii]
MDSYLQRLLAGDGHEKEKFLQRLKDDKNWSAVSFIDELLPVLLFEANLTYGNFHQVKMAVFLRSLARKNKLSRASELAVLNLFLTEVRERNWLDVRAENKYFSQSVDEPVRMMLEELAEKNAHNAFYYALQAYEEKADYLQDLLLSLGGVYGPENLGHSLSCFFPVFEELVNTRHPAAESAILSHLLYLNRYEIPPDFAPDDYALDSLPENAMRRAASGQGIINLHHMITLVIYRLWERASFHSDNFPLPYKIYYHKRIEDKAISQERLERVKEDINLKLPENFADFYECFSYEDVEYTTKMIRGLAEKNLSRLQDWIIRLYALNYDKEKWNPHYYTGIYLALRLKEEDILEDRLAGEMALDQAVEYYL